MTVTSDYLQFLDGYLADSRDCFQEADEVLLALEQNPDQRGSERLDQLFRNAHTLKGSSAMLNFPEIAELAHATEDMLGRLRAGDQQISHSVVDTLFAAFDALKSMVKERARKKGKKGLRGGTRLSSLYSRLSDVAERASGPPSGKQLQHQAAGTDRNDDLLSGAIETIETVRVNVGLLDSLFNLVGELLITKRRIDNLLPEAGKDLRSSLGAMDRLINEIQEDVSDARLVKADEVLRRFPRMVRNLAREQDKEVDLVMEGQEIDLDKAVLDAIGEPLLHLLRNAVDHGIESAEVRRQRSKPLHGRVTLKVRRMESYIEVAVEDDGAGIELQELRDAFVSKGLLDAAEARELKRDGLLELIFEPGFTTAAQVNQVSGRGVGLDVVRTTAERLGGTVTVQTQPGNGCRFGMRLPLSTALTQTLMVGTGDHHFAIPSDLVLETMAVEAPDVREVGDEQFLLFRNEPIPFYPLNKLLGFADDMEQAETIAVVLSSGEQLIGLGVNSLEYQSKTIVKPLDSLAGSFRGFSGGTIRGDGQVVLLLDIPTLLSQQSASAAGKPRRTRSGDGNGAAALTGPVQAIAPGSRQSRSIDPSVP